MVKRLRRSPLKAESGVRFSVGLPKKSNTPFRRVTFFTYLSHGERTTKEFGSATVAQRRCFSVGRFPVAKRRCFSVGLYTTVAQRRCFSVGILFPRSAAEVLLRGAFSRSEA